MVPSYLTTRSCTILPSVLMEQEYRKRIDFSDKQAQRMWEYDEEKVSKLIATMPMTKWSGSSKGLLSFDGKLFSKYGC